MIQEYKKDMFEEYVGDITNQCFTTAIKDFLKHMKGAERKGQGIGKADEWQRGKDKAEARPRPGKGKAETWIWFKNIMEMSWTNKSKIYQTNMTIVIKELLTYVNRAEASLMKSRGEAQARHGQCNIMAQRQEQGGGMAGRHRQGRGQPKKLARQRYGTSRG